MQELGLEPREPHFVCDGCGATGSIYTTRGDVAQWFLRRRSPPPGWSGLRMADGSRRWDLCPACWKEPADAADGETLMGKLTDEAKAAELPAPKKRPRRKT